ncbi:hypothetical protein AQUCO_01400878v1 [Aquilegia coerulea]|uniref:Plastid lipid-associated protein/fibrillin conserved domain-containing protein n=1 Tax=Aquilegia coerulea TaxID=218851 RepID=A0A2G5DYK3_AQUCA|nr:hypothetical protein AQUCO_01400878v1 [Aquilegia coerulea]
MATSTDLIYAFTGLRALTPSSSSSSSSSSIGSLSFSSVFQFHKNGGKLVNNKRKVGVCRAMVQQTYQGASANYAKEMERLSAKESLLLALKDSGGFESMITGKTVDMQRIDVNERITGLERLNPTPRPTTSPFLEGRWNCEWLGTSSPILFVTKLIFERFPSTLVSLLGVDVAIKDGYAIVTANTKFLNSIESKFILTTKLSVEGPLRMKEESVEGVFETPKVNEEAIPEQLKGALGQAVGTLQQLPLPTDLMTSGLKIPLGGLYERLYMISYLDEEILILRDTSGVPEVLTRLEAISDPEGVEQIVEYES